MGRTCRRDLGEKDIAISMAGARLLCAAGVNKHKAGTMGRDAAERLGLGASDAAAVGGVQVLQWGKAKRR